MNKKEHGWMETMMGKLDYDVVIRDKDGRVKEIIRGRGQTDGTVIEEAMHGDDN